MQQHAHTQVRTDLLCTPSTIHAKKVLAFQQASVGIGPVALRSAVVHGFAVQTCQEVPACIENPYLAPRPLLSQPFDGLRAWPQTDLRQTRSGPTTRTVLSKCPKVACLHVLHDAEAQGQGTHGLAGSAAIARCSD